MATQSNDWWQLCAMRENVPMASGLSLDDYRLFPAETTVRNTAWSIYSRTRDLPIISPHGHVPPAWLSENSHFGDPTRLLLTPDHYINRILHANGVELSKLGVGQGPLSEADSREAWRTFCEHWADLNGTVMRYWLTDQLVGLFGVTKRPSAATADEIYDIIQSWIDDEANRPKQLLDRLNIELIATTDDPCDDLHEHAALSADEEFSAKHRVAPTFRPDKYLMPGYPHWNYHVDALAQITGTDLVTFADFTRALEERRAYFKAHGGVSSDHGVADLAASYMDAADVERLYAKARRKEITRVEAHQLHEHMIMDQVRMASEDGLTLTFHPGILRDYDHQTYAAYGCDVGADIPTTLEVTRATREMLNRFGNHPNLHMVLFTVDEDTYSREIAPLAGFYRSVYIGVPWWFVDAPNSIMRFKDAVTEMAGFSRIAGMIDDTRAFCSIPARHDMMRRLDAVHLASLVQTHRLDLDEAVDQAIRLVVDNPKTVFKL